MRKIPTEVLAEITSDPYYRVCARAIDGGCGGRLTLEHVIVFAGRQLNAKWAIIPLCAKHHSVLQYQDTGLLDKRINTSIALNRATDSELRAISKCEDYVALRQRLNEKFNYRYRAKERAGDSVR